MNGWSVHKKPCLFFGLVICLVFHGSVFAAENKNTEPFEKLFPTLEVHLKSCNLAVTRRNPSVMKWQANLAKLSLVLVGESPSFFMCDGESIVRNPGVTVTGAGPRCITIESTRWGNESSSYVAFGSVSLDERALEQIRTQLASCSSNKNKKYIVRLNPTDSPQESRRSGSFQYHADSPKHDLGATHWTATCDEGGTAGVYVRDNMPNIYSWTGYGFSGSSSGSQAGIGVDAALTKGCQGR